MLLKLAKVQVWQLDWAQQLMPLGWALAKALKQVQAQERAQARQGRGLWRPHPDLSTAQPDFGPE
jgi:uncharacterized protein YegL